MKTRVVHTSVWSDDKIGELPFEGRGMFVYLLSNDRINICGTYELPMRKIAFDTGMTPAAAAKAVESLERIGRVLYRDGWVHIPNAGKYNSYSGPKNDVARAKEEALIPEWFKALISDIKYGTDTSIDTRTIGTRNQKSEIRNQKEGGEGGNVPAMSEDTAEVWDYWERTLAPITRNQGFHRNAIARLNRERGKDSVMKAIRIAAAAHADKYAGKALKVTNPKQLEESWDALVIWAKAKAAQSSVPQDDRAGIVIR